MTGTNLKFRSKFWIRLDSVPATGRNFSGILNLDNVHYFEARVETTHESFALSKTESRIPTYVEQSFFSL
jgi:hypothetical protein